MTGEDRFSPDWASRTLSNKPDWVDFIPHELWELGEVFFPIPRGRKGWSYPHHLDEYRHAPGSEVLNAYFDAGWGYGIACADDLVVVDIDEMHMVKEITQKLPTTMWQKSGSREGYHLFYHCPGLDTRITLYDDVIHDCDNEEHSCRMDLEEKCIRITDHDHLGEVKCDPHGYVVGPGSVHPSGNTYGPINGDSITEISRSELKDILSEYEKDDGGSDSYRGDDISFEDVDDRNVHDFYSLSADDVLPSLQEGKRVSHPVHGSTTGTNFKKDSGGETFTCWRCQYGSGDGCGLNGAQYLAVESTHLDCDDVRRFWQKDSTLQYKAWIEAVRQGLADHRDIPYAVLQGYAVHNGMISSGDKLAGETYWDAYRCMSWEVRVKRALGQL